MDRLDTLRTRLAGAKLDGLVVTHLPNVCYLTGFTGSAGVLVVTEKQAWLVTDGRYRVQAGEEVRKAKVSVVRGDAIPAAGKLVAGTRAKRVGFEASRLSVAALERLKAAGGHKTRWKGVDGLIEELRIRKDPQELDLLRAAARLGSSIFEDVLPLVRPGTSELDLAAEIEYRMKQKGASGPSFETIVASGPRTALPHARPTSRRLGKNELVLFDWGAILRGYCSDLTRTVFLGRAPSRVRRMYQAVLGAQNAAREAIRAGATAQSIDRAARKHLAHRGLARYFVHSTGHGLGLEIHEEPRLARGQTRILEPGHVVTLEPGVYLEGLGGIRIEDDLVVTASGVEVLTSASREFFQL